MFFDLHTDILFDIVRKRMNQKTNIIKDDHLPQLSNGNITGGIWTYFTDIQKPLCQFDQAIDYILEELEKAKDYIQIVKNKNDFNTNKVNVVLGFESLQPVRDVEHLKEMYDYGFRHAMLTWNEENHFATGVLGNEQHGLKDEGKEIINFMNQHNMIIDVSHTNVKSFNDILDATPRPVIASHSNVFSLCQHPRNLQDDQINRLTKAGGVMGITAVRAFVNPQEGTVANMVNHIDHLKALNLLNHVAVGFDFMDYLGGKNLDDLPSADHANRLIEELIKRNYTEEDIDHITHVNALRILKSLL